MRKKVTSSFAASPKWDCSAFFTNQSVLGSDTFSTVNAWAVCDEFLRNRRITICEEPPGLEDYWRTSTMREKQGSNWWTDTYLAAFAFAADFTLVTFDAQLAARKNVRTRLLR